MRNFTKRTQKKIWALLFLLLAWNIPDLVAQQLFAQKPRGKADVLTQDKNQQRQKNTIKLSLHAENASLPEILREIEKQSGFYFVYFDEEINGDTKHTVVFEGQSMESLLDALLTPANILYTFKGKQIILQRKKSSPAGITPQSAGQDEPTGETKEKEKVSVTQASYSNLSAFQVMGNVTDEFSSGLPGVNVLEKGTTNGTTTDSNGGFSINVSDGTATLVFSYIGYAQQEVKLASQSTLTVSLIPDITSLSEVIVVGYGTTKKSDLTGSVSSVKADQLTAFPTTGAAQALQGRAAGVQIAANNGAPGSDLKIRIRGGSSINASSDPIFVVDGFVGGTLPPPEDIQSIEILKDASATAIYGSRGANGVILVTTKKGKAGATRIDFNSSYSFQNEINRLDLLNGPQFENYIKEINPAYTTPGENTDWQEEIFRRGAIANNQLSFSGGSEAVKYYVAGASFQQKGVVDGSEYGRSSVTSNLDFTGSSRLKLGVNIFGQRDKTTGPITQEASGGAIGTGVVSAAFKYMPDQGIFNPDGTYTTAIVGDPTDNPVAIAREYENETVNDRFQGNFYADFSIFDNLTFKTTLGASFNDFRTGVFIPTTLNAGKTSGGDASVNGGKRTNFINENYLTYTAKIAQKHSMTVLAGYSLQKFRDERWGGRSQSFVSNSVSYWNLGAGSVTQIPNSSLSESQLASYYARLNFSFADRYLLTFNARYDGSSNFSKNNKWAFFPSGAIAWNMTNERFMSDIRFISLWKWRVSYGLTGNQAISPYQTLARFSNVLAIQNGVPVNAVIPTTVANDNLTWETSTQLDIGADIGLLDDRITLTVDYYNRTTSDLLFSVPLPQYSGFTTQLKNVGKVENKGFELSIVSQNTTGKFKWVSDLNISANKNQVLELPADADIFYGSGPGHLVGIGSQTQVLRVGLPVGSFFGYQYDGVYKTGESFLPGAGFEQAPGGEKFKDLTGDGNLNSDDREVIGDPNPTFIWGFNNDFKWNNFDLNVFFQASQGNDILSYTFLELETMAGFNNSTTRALNRWTETNTETDVPRAFGGRTQRVSSRYVFDGSYVRLKNISLGYTLPASIIEKLFLKKVRVYASAQNILTFTDYRGFDPEVNYSSGSGANANRNLGLDYGSYPNSKSYTVGLSLGF